MSDLSQSSVRNLLLRALPVEAFDILRPEMKTVELPLRHELVLPGVKDDFVLHRLLFATASEHRRNVKRAQRAY